MSTRLNFVLEGRDQLSRVLDRAGDSANRMSRRILTASINSDAAMRRFANNTVRSMADIDRSSHDSAKAMQALKGAVLGLAPAAIPAAASLAPIAATAGAAGVAVGAFGVALAGQLGPLGEAVDAEKKYNDAVAEHGARSKEAAAAQADYLRQVEKLPPATRKAAASLSVLKDEYKGWSDSLAGDTMAPVTKSFAILGALLPKLTPTVQGASRELDRLINIAGGAVASPGFNAFTLRLDGMTTGAIKRANDALIRLMRTADTGKVGSGLSEFLAYARAQGPAVADTLKNLGSALGNILNGASGVGVSMLTLVNTLSRLLAAVPPGAIATFLQLAIAIKAVQLAAVGVGAGRAALASFGTQILAMRTAAAAAPGPLAATGAAITALSRTAKLAIAGTGIGLLIIALSELAARTRTAPPDVDALASSLKKLGATNAATGETARLFGADLDGLYDKVRSLTDPAENDKFEQFMTGLVNLDSKPLKDAKEAVDAIDKALASLVSAGRTDLAAAATKRLAAEYAAGGKDASKFTGQLNDYQDALADVKFEQDLAAAAMGIYGQQSQAVKAKLDAQKQSTDALRMALFELTNINRDAAGAMSDFEAAIDNVAKVTGDHRGSLKMVNGELDLNSAKAREADAALRDLAAKAQTAAAAAQQQGKSNEYVNGILDRGRQQLVNHARELTGDKAAADALARSYLAVPDKTARLKGNIEDLQAKLATAKSQLGKVPDARKAQVRADISQLQRQLDAARNKLDTLDGKTAVTYVTTVYSSDRVVSPDGHNGPGGFPKHARGTNSAEAGWALVGEEGPELVRMQGGERVFDHRTSMAMLSQVDAGRAAAAGLAAGMTGSTAGVEQSARLMAGAITAGVRAELQIASPSKKMTALMADVKGGIVKGLTGSKAAIKATAMDLVKDIWKAWEGTKSNKDSGLVQMVNREHAKLQALATKRDSLNSRISAAQKTLRDRIEEQASYRAGLKSNAQSASSLSSLGLEPAQVTIGTIRGGLQQKLAKLRQFNGYITKLIKRGLNKNLLRQILAMGPEEGFAYAAALAGMTNTDFKSVNSTQAAIDRESDSLARAGSKALYDAGVNSAKGLLKGLQSQEAAIEQQMVKIAQGMERAIKKALGIKSPSRVGTAIGLNFGQSVGSGTLAALPTVGHAVDALAGRMTAIRPMPGLPAAGLAAAGPGGTTVVNNFHIEGAMDPVRVGQEVQKVLLSLKRINGGTLGI
ncbi:hypothetical protein [Streptomyces sp. NPDC013489]|uniref:hypothetical protein n=1 Tax=Streptomyces sp. NPDC013489 TaxID=3155606 RepID=UPI0033E439DF